MVLIEIENINTDVLYIAGTKFEANATKNGFVLKKSTLNYRSKLYIKITNLINIINHNFNFSYNIYESYETEYLNIICDDLFKMVDKDGKSFVYGKGSHKTLIQRCYGDMFKYIKIQQTPKHLYLLWIDTKNNTKTYLIIL